MPTGRLYRRLRIALAIAAVLPPLFLNSLRANADTELTAGSPEIGAPEPTPPPTPTPSPTPTCAWKEFSMYHTTLTRWDPGQDSMEKIIKFADDPNVDQAFLDLITGYFSGFVRACDMMGDLWAAIPGRDANTEGRAAAYNQCRANLAGFTNSFGRPWTESGIGDWCYDTFVHPRAGAERGYQQACLQYGVAMDLLGPGYSSANYVAAGLEENYWNWSNQSAQDNSELLPAWFRNALSSTSFANGPFPFDSTYSRVTFYIRKEEVNGQASIEIRPMPLSGERSCLLGALATQTSPVSLILDEQAFADVKMKTVSFSLDARSEKGFSGWLASEASPLLITLKGKDDRAVTSASQLFGNWSGAQGTLQEPTFPDGYQALAALDINDDGFLSGGELTHLALWSDRDRNGKSTPHEIRLLSEVGIRKIFFDGAERTSSGDLELRIGFEREVDGKMVRGRSLDWFAPTSMERIAVETKVAIRNIALAPTSTEGKTRAGSPPNSHEGAAEERKLSGLWKVTLDGRSAPSSVLLLSPELDSNRLRGIAFIQAQAPSAHEGERAVHALQLGGTFQNKTQVTGTWVLPGDSDTVVTSTFAVHGSVMRGESTVTMPKGRGTEQLKYSWTAEKVH